MRCLCEVDGGKERKFAARFRRCNPTSDQDYKVSGISSEVMQQRLENLVDSWSAILPYIIIHSLTFLFQDTYLSTVELLLNYSS